MGKINPEFEEETVVITGATSGIGREIALRFGAAGANVVIGDIEKQPKNGDISTDELIETRGGTAEFLKTDVTDREQIRELINEAQKHGGVDIMVNNAGVFIKGSIRELSPEEFDKIHAVNTKGVYFGTQVAANDMINRSVEGTIINTASISSNLAQPDQVQYDSSKGGVRMITRGSALELAEYNIRVNAVAPGITATEFFEGWSEEAPTAVAEGDLVKDVPLGRAGEPKDIAGAYLFLASEAAEYITGEHLFVDGGWQAF